MQHNFFFDGNIKKIAWVIQTGNSIIEQKREHVDIYKDKVTIQQSKYISLHVGLFWGVGRFILNNEDTVIIKNNDRTIIDFLVSSKKHSDKFIKNRIFFIKQLIEQRKLKIKYEFVDGKENMSSLSLN